MSSNGYLTSVTWVSSDRTSTKTFTVGDTVHSKTWDHDTVLEIVKIEIDNILGTTSFKFIGEDVETREVHYTHPAACKHVRN